MKQIMCVVLLCAGIFLPALAVEALEDEFFETRVQRVVSGDRIILRGGTVVHYAGIIAPNAMDPRPVFAEQAKTAFKENERLVKNKTIRIECVEEGYSSAKKTAYVFSSGVFINGYLVKQGLAIVNDVINPKDKYFNYLVRVQQEAQQAQRGVWSKVL